MKDRFSILSQSPFFRLADLLGDQKPGHEPILMAAGEPGHPIPEFVADVLKQHAADLRRYPLNNGTPMLREAIAGWLNGRFDLGDAVDPNRHVLPLCGSREGLTSISLIVVPPGSSGPKPKAIIPNPLYYTYAAAAVAAGAEPYYVSAGKETGFLPDLDTLTEDVLDSAACFYLSSPADPQGTIADVAYLKKAILLARKHDFVLLVDECYSEIYDKIKPVGALKAAQELSGSFENVLVFNSLSKRSNLAGLRVGLCAGDEELLARFLKFRTLGGPTIPRPNMAAAAAAWADESHVEENRRLYRAKFDIAEDIFGDRFEFYRPPGGFFLWLNVSEIGGDEAAAIKFWKEAGVKVVPGSYFSVDDDRGVNPGADYVRIALVHSEATTRDALERMHALS